MSNLKNTNNKFVAVDNNVPALSATKQKAGTTYIFYYNQNGEISYLLGADVSDYAEKIVKVKDSSGQYNPVKGSNSPLTTTTWNDEVGRHELIPQITEQRRSKNPISQVRLYYIDSNKYIKELCLGSDGKWFYGKLTDKNFKAASHSGLYAAGNADYEKNGGNITVLFMDGDNDNNLTEATISVSSGQWEKQVVTN
ncbi:hypothetical protein PRK78_002243 [Emydomyces testavorans]|uniref:Fucose-specific lectin n=1 Tax=Emydomyces testavorans TaxID=2070801 RepID=A0AAF0IJG6_9EURO|nr:hypothetical protein PRK78_002243 [Emydomyces testavorans]